MIDSLKIYADSKECQFEDFIYCKASMLIYQRAAGPLHVDNIKGCKIVTVNLPVNLPLSVANDLHLRDFIYIPLCYFLSF